MNAISVVPSVVYSLKPSFYLGYLPNDHDGVNNCDVYDDCIICNFCEGFDVVFYMLLFVMALLTLVAKVLASKKNAAYSILT
jgi:hypothetical protein